MTLLASHTAVASSSSDMIAKHLNDFDELPTYFEGDSRILKEVEDDELLLCRLKPTIFSLADQGPVPLPGIEKVRTDLNALLCEHLHKSGVKTSTVATRDGLILMKKEKVPPIEVIVKGAHVGSPKHIYKGLSQHPVRSGRRVRSGANHAPYVRFDWRNPLPDEDLCMPEALADRYIDVETTKQTVLKAYKSLRVLFNQHGMDLQDICFFMNESGDTICAEVSTDNTRIVYQGEDAALRELFSSREKDRALERAEAVLSLLQSPKVERKRVILSGPFCTGKTSLIARMNDVLGIPKFIDDATRAMRPGETDGFPYHFITREEFQQRRDAGDYFEWVEFKDNYYGVPRKGLFEKKAWVMDILSTSWGDYWGRVPGMVSVYLEAPDNAELVRRARARGDAEDKIQQRLDALKDEDSSGYDYLIPAMTSLDEKLEIMRWIVCGDDRADQYLN